METEPTAKGGRKKKETAKRKSTRKTNTVSSDDDDEEEAEQNHMPPITEDSETDFEVEEATKPKRAGGRGKKADNDNAKKAAKPGPTRKRGPSAAAAQKNSIISQKLITDILKPVDGGVGLSPEKKVRKMRGSPFNKKSGSVLGRTNNIILSDKSDESGSSLLDAPAAASRPKRERKVVTKYVMSESEEEDDDVDDSEDYSGSEEEDDE